MISQRRRRIFNTRSKNEHIRWQIYLAIAKPLISVSAYKDKDELLLAQQTAIKTLLGGRVVAYLEKEDS